MIENLKRGSINLRFGHNSLLVLSVSILFQKIAAIKVLEKDRGIDLNQIEN